MSANLNPRLRAFMDEHIYPNEKLYREQIAQATAGSRVPSSRS